MSGGISSAVYPPHAKSTPGPPLFTSLLTSDRFFRNTLLPSVTSYNLVQKLESSSRISHNSRSKSREATMPRSVFSGTLSSPKVDFAVDMGNPFLNRTVDGFIKIGVVGAGKVVAEEAFDCLTRGSVSKHKAEEALKKMCKEGAYWGTVAGVYVGMEYGMERVRGRRDWKNAMLGGALTGALISAASNNHKDKVMRDAITGGAVATAAEFLNYLT